MDVRDAAARFGTPLLLCDEAHLRERLARYRAAFGPDTVLVYAGKAFLCGALVERLDEAGWWIDVVSGAELALVTRAGHPPERTVLHGNAKPRAELADALARGVGRIVVDHPGEIRALDALAGDVGGGAAAVLLRLNADVAAVTHRKVKTTGAKAQFGMDPETAAATAREAREAPAVVLAGVHLHAGSQIRDLDTFRRAADAVVGFVEPIRALFPERVDLDLGGGMPVPYLRDDPAPGIAEYAGALLEGLEDARATERLGRFRLFVEPGRSVIATSTVTIYRVEARKRLPDGRDLLAVDGGLSDNPRPSLYGQPYEAVSVSRPTAPHDRTFHLVGRHCETGDVINEEARLPAATDVGDLVAVPVTGAYAHSMSSRYNGLGRPPVVWLRDGAAREVVRRETVEDLVACDRVLGDRPSR